VGTQNAQGQQRRLQALPHPLPVAGLVACDGAAVDHAAAENTAAAAAADDNSVGGCPAAAVVADHSAAAVVGTVAGTWTGSAGASQKCYLAAELLGR